MIRRFVEDLLASPTVAALAREGLAHLARKRGCRVRTLYEGGGLREEIVLVPFEVRVVVVRLLSWRNEL